MFSLADSNFYYLSFFINTDPGLNLSDMLVGLTGFDLPVKQTSCLFKPILEARIKYLCFISFLVYKSYFILC